MSLHNTDAYVIETSGVAESLPDPTTVANRQHILTNTGSVTAVWSSTGATPFTENGVNVATISIPRGTSKQVQSNGTRWVVAPVASVPKSFRGTGVTNGSGNVTFNYAGAAFGSTPVVVGQVGPSGDNALVECKLTAVSATSATFNVRRAPAVTILGISVVTFPINASGVTVQCLAFLPGTTA